MTDFFALLDQPRAPWLDPVELKGAFHAKTLQAHPDARAPGSDVTEAEAIFARINEAYQVLQDPKRRLLHLLTLEGEQTTPSGGEAPAEIAELFQTVAATTQEAERVAQKAAAATNPLSRSLLKAEVLQVEGRINGALQALMDLRREANEELKRVGSSTADPGADRVRQLQQLYLRFSYLGRWIEQLEEKRTQLVTG
jgi:curved DNA-binding protein CbpA